MSLFARIFGGLYKEDENNEVSNFMDEFLEKQKAKDVVVGTYKDLIIKHSFNDICIMGQYQGFDFSAKTYCLPSPMGINGGKVSKLSIWRNDLWGDEREFVVHYDRGWDIEPQNGEIALLTENLVELLEEFREVYQYECDMIEVI